MPTMLQGTDSNTDAPISFLAGSASVVLVHIEEVIDGGREMVSNGSRIGVEGKQFRCVWQRKEKEKKKNERKEVEKKESE